MPHKFYSGSMRIKRGIYLSDLNVHNLLRDVNNSDTYKKDYPYINEELNCYGIVDTIEQFCFKYYKLLDKSPTPFIVVFNHIAKTENGGFRWHKWGPYYGDGIPTREYLSDEDDFENGIYVYHIHVVDYIKTKPQIKSYPIDYLAPYDKDIEEKHLCRAKKYRRFFRICFRHNKRRKSSLLSNKIHRRKIPTKALYDVRQREIKIIKAYQKRCYTVFKENRPRYVWNWRKLK